MIPNNVAKFVEAVSRQFNPPKLEEREAAMWLMDYVDELQSWPENVLAHAAKIIRAKRTDRRFPLPAECAAACREADKEIGQAKRDANLLTHGERDQSPWATWRQEMANRLIQTPMGKKAAAEGWIASLWNYCREHGRLPDESHAKAMASDAGALVDLVKELAGDPDGLAQMCARWGRNVLQRRREMADFVDGNGEAVWTDLRQHDRKG